MKELQGLASKTSEEPRDNSGEREIRGELNMQRSIVTAKGKHCITPNR